MSTELTVEELAQEATGEGYDPDEVWDDEPSLDIDVDNDDLLDLDDPEDTEPKQAVIEETVQ